jgi:two-component system sensor histidine kinase SenX3
VVLSARRQNGMVELDVSDQGSGFPNGFAAQAFERFTRADAGRGGGGTGLGLAIVRAIAVAHGGQVSVVSGGGNPTTTLRLTLPVG